MHLIYIYKYSILSFLLGCGFFAFSQSGNIQKKPLTKRDSLLIRYRMEGYLDVSADTIALDGSPVIRTGRAVQGIVLYPADKRKTENPLFHNKDSIFIPVKDLPGFLTSLQKGFNERGFPFARVYLHPIIRNDSILRAFVHAETFDKRHIDTVVVEGYTSFPRKILYKETEIAPGNILNINTLNKSLRILEKTNIATVIRPPEILFTRDSTFVFLYLKKKQSNSFDGLAGFGYDKNNERKIRLSGNMHLVLDNPFNLGEHLGLEWTADGSGFSRLHTSISYPYIYQTPISGEIHFQMEKRDTAYVNSDLDISVKYRLSKYTDIGIVWQYDNSRPLNAINPYSPFTSTKYGIAFGYHFRKKSGWHGDIRNVLSTGKRNGKPQSLAIFKFITGYRPASGRHEYVFSGEATYLFSREYFPNELLKTGGMYSIKGFDENYFSGKAYVITRFMYYYHLNPAHMLYPFIHTGYIAGYDAPDIFAYSFGTGYGYEIKNGKISIEYALGNTNTRPFGFSRAKLHVGYAAYF